MNPETLHPHTIRNKKRLVELYINQFRESHIIREINRILTQERSSIPEALRTRQKRLSTREVLLFIYANGVPDRYVLSEEMRMKLNDLRAGKGFQGQSSQP